MFSGKLWELFLDSFPKILLPGLTMTIPLTAISFTLALIIAVAMALVQFANVPGAAGGGTVRRAVVYADGVPHRPAPGHAHGVSAPVQLPDRHGEGHLSGRQHHGDGDVHGDPAGPEKPPCCGA